MLDRHLFDIVKNALGLEFVENYPTDFDNRLIVQKVLYLLTHFKEDKRISLPYNWTFYLRGPYSSEIAHMMYYMNDFLPELKNGHEFLEEKEKDALATFEQFKEAIESYYLSDLDGSTLSRAELFETLATLTYIAKQVKDDREKLLSIFSGLKPSLAGQITPLNLSKLCDILESYQFI